IPWASVGFELPATSLIAPFFPDILRPSPSLSHRRRGHNKADRAGQYGCKLYPSGGEDHRRLAGASRERQSLAIGRRRSWRFRVAATLVARGGLGGHTLYRIGYRLKNAEYAGRFRRGFMRLGHRYLGFTHRGRSTGRNCWRGQKDGEPFHAIAGDPAEHCVIGSCPGVVMTNLCSLLAADAQGTLFLLVKYVPDPGHCGLMLRHFDGQIATHTIGRRLLAG